jgi:hypothetical protein
MSKATVVKVPHVQGKLSLSMWELMEVASGEGVWGKEKLWTARNFPGLEALGTKDSGDVWKGPNLASS